jgi:SAM-dependent methyltransferase
LSNRSQAEIPEDFAARWKSRFERFARLNDDDAGIAGWSTSGLETRFRNFRRLWTAADRDTHWLDIGCGAGTYSRFLAGEGLRVIAMDYSFPSLLKARRRGPANIEWVAGDVARLPLRPGTLDGALCFGVLQAIPASRPALRSLAAALKPAGTLWIDVLNARCVANKLEMARLRRAGKPVHLRYETAQAFGEALRECGFAIVATHWIPILPAKVRRLQPIVELGPVRLLLRRLPALGAWLSHSVLVEARLRGGGEQER